MNKKEGKSLFDYPKRAISVVRSLIRVGKKCTLPGANKLKGKNDTYLEILKGYMPKDNGVNLLLCFKKQSLNQNVENKANRIQFQKEYTIIVT